MHNSPEELYRLTLNLCKIPSVSGDAGKEDEAARFMADWFGKLPYFKAHPGEVKLLPALEDPQGRQGVYALVRAARPTDKTVILSGHLDVVDVDVCGPVKEWAFDPEEYTRRIGELSLDDHARKDLEGGEYLFGRGVMDMKSGLALGMGLLGEMSEKPEDLDVNLLFLGVGDEESNSSGMRGAIPHLVALQEEKGLDFLALFLLEPVAESPGNPVSYFSVGTIGKIMPFFLCVGRESHVDKYAQGFSAPLMASHINIIAEGHPQTREFWKDQTFDPMTCLKMKDLREHYSVTIPERAVVYYNLFMVQKGPGEILRTMVSFARKGLEKALEQQREPLGEAFSGKMGAPRVIPRVITFEELKEKAYKKKGHNLVEKALDKTIKEFPQDMDLREKSLGVAEKVLDLAGEKGPIVIVGFLPPFYPYRTNKRETPKERGVIRLAEELTTLAKDQGKTYRLQEILPGISDMSWLGIPREDKETALVAPNMPGYGEVFQIPLESLQKVDIPGLNMGPFGYDAHQQTERLHVAHSFEVVPKLLRHGIARIRTLWEEEARL